MTIATIGVNCSHFILVCTTKHHISHYKNFHEKRFDMFYSSHSCLIRCVGDLFSGTVILWTHYVYVQKAFDIWKESEKNLRKF